MPLSHLSLSIRLGNEWLPAARLEGDGGSATPPFAARWSGSREISLSLRRLDGQSFAPEAYRVEVAVPLRNYAHTVVPDCGRHYVNTAKGLDIRSGAFGVHAANAGHPFFALADESGRFWFAFGIPSAAGEVRCRRVLPRISSSKAMVGGDDLLALSFEWDAEPGARPEWRLEFFVAGREKTWFHALRRYTAGIRKREKIVYPSHPEAWTPAWCTWTAFSSDDMTAKRVLENAAIARDLGMGSVILDDGWFGPGLDSEMTLNLGDYEPDPTKFPDLPATVQAIQAMDLKAILWHAPLCIARTSRRWTTMQKYAIWQDGKEFTSVNGLAQLCPACPDVRRYVEEETARLFREYGVDGLKVDLYNCLPTRRCESTLHAHDIPDGVAAVDATMAGQWAAALRAKPDALFELKQDYGNVRLCRHGTMLRAGDTGYDVNTNLRRCFYNQAYAPCVHNDYFVSDYALPPSAFALAMLRMLTAGVPTFGSDLTRLSPAHRAVIRAWLAFYRAELPIFQTPREPQDNSLAVWQGGTRSRKWVSAWVDAREIQLPPAPTIFVMNGTPHDHLYVRVDRKRRVHATLLDHRLREVSRRSLTLADGTLLPVPQGGMARLES